MSIAQLMDLKFYLNKFLKCDNIENYTLEALGKLRAAYDTFLENSKGTDPDFPMIDFGNKGQKINGVNKMQLGRDLDDDFDGTYVDHGTKNLLSLTR